MEKPRLDVEVQRIKTSKGNKTYICKILRLCSDTSSSVFNILLYKKALWIYGTNLSSSVIRILPT